MNDYTSALFRYMFPMTLPRRWRNLTQAWVEYVGLWMWIPEELAPEPKKTKKAVD